MKAQAVPGMSQAVLLVLGVAERALAAHGVRPWQGDVLLQQHGQDLVVVPVGRQDDGRHVHGGGVLGVLDALHEFLMEGGGDGGGGKGGRGGGGGGGGKEGRD